MIAKQRLAGLFAIRFKISHFFYCHRHCIKDTYHLNIHITFMYIIILENEIENVVSKMANIFFFCLKVLLTPNMVDGHQEFYLFSRRECFEIKTHLTTFGILTGNKEHYSVVMLAERSVLEQTPGTNSCHLIIIRLSVNIKMTIYAVPVRRDVSGCAVQYMGVSQCGIQYYNINDISLYG